MGWARGTSFIRMLSPALGKVCKAYVCAVITSHFLAPWVMCWLLMLGCCRGPAVMKMCCSYLMQLPCVRVCACMCVCRGRCSAPSLQRPWHCCSHLFFPPWAVWHSKLFCAVCHQDCSTVECRRKATAWGLCLVLGNSWGLCLLRW